QFAVFAFMALYGMSNGFSLSLFGSLWPEIYGLRHLGAIRAVILSLLVFASATGPGLAGLLIDAGVSYLGLVVGLGVYCLAVSVLMLKVVPQLKARTD
ncbi:MAG: MFS transporter, partial [Pseudomonadota bacterium]